MTESDSVILSVVEGSTKMKKNIFVTGLHGFIGSRFAQLAGQQFKIADYGRPDITKPEQVNRVIGRNDIDVVLHLAAKAHIDPCERDRKFGTKGETWKVNVVGTKNNAKACKKYGKYLLFLSTECVFDGEVGNYTEEDSPNPKNWYGETKFHAEQEVLESRAKACILRSVLSYGHPEPHRYDIAHTMRAKLINNQEVLGITDQYVSFTFIDDLVHALLLLIQEQKNGIYHYAGDTLTPYEFAIRLKENEKIARGTILPSTLDEYFGKKAKLRLKNATLSSQKIKREFGIEQDRAL